jgi:hypothetical protein
MMMNRKGFGRKLSSPNFKVPSRYSPGGPVKNHENLSQDSRSPGSKIEHGNSRIRSRSVNHTATTFGVVICQMFV